MEKLLKILWGIPEDKWIEHKFEAESSASKIFEQEIAETL